MRERGAPGHWRLRPGNHQDNTAPRLPLHSAGLTPHDERGSGTANGATPTHPPPHAGKGRMEVQPASPDSGPQSQSSVDRPSVAVLPFANLSGDPQQDYFSDGITEDIITELSRFSELMVIAR